MATTQAMNKHDLEQYLTSLDLEDTIELESRATEIAQTVRESLEPHYAIEGSEPVRDYYEPAIQGLERAAQAADFHEAFPEAVRYMVATIRWE